MSRAADLGSSLLSKKQARDDKFRKRKESWEKRAAWAEVLVPPIIEGATDWVMTDNIREFDKNEELIRENQEAKLALDNAQTWLGIHKTIQEQYGGNAFQYYGSIDREEAERRAAEALRAEGLDIYHGEYGPFQNEITALVDGWAQDSADEYEEAMKLIRQLGTKDEYDAMVALNRKDARSDNIFGTLINKAKNWARSTTQQEVDDRAIQNIENSQIAQSYDALNTFQKEYNRTRNVMQSYDFTQWANNLKFDSTEEEHDQLWTLKERDVDATTVEGAIIFRGTETWQSLNTDRLKTVPIEEDSIEFFERDPSPAAAQKIFEDIARKVYGEANFHTMVVDQLTTEGVQEFTNLVEQRTGKSLIAIEAGDNIVEDLQTVSDVYGQMTKERSKYLKDEVMDAALAAQFDLIQGEVQAMLLDINDFDYHDPRYEETLNMHMRQFSTKIQSLITANNGIRRIKSDMWTEQEYVN